MNSNEKAKRVFASPLVRMILILVILWLLFYLGREVYWLIINKKQIKEVQEEQKSLIKENEILEEKIKRAGTEEFIEEKARDFGFQKPGEEVIIIVPEDENNQDDKKNKEN